MKSAIFSRSTVGADIADTRSTFCSKLCTFMSPFAVVDVENFLKYLLLVKGS